MEPGARIWSHAVVGTSEPEYSETGQSPSQPGDSLGRYRLLKKLARGGMAEVFAARSFGAHGFEKTLAIKRILPRYGQDPQFVRMMVDEAKITVLLNHPNVANIVELCEQDGDYFIVMEFVPGQSLSTVVKKLRERGERFGVLEACFIVVELLQGLHAAHVQKDASGNPAYIIHRDVSPQNVLVSFDGHVKVIDFGIARARDCLEETEIGTIKGKLRYLAPEMIDPARFMKTGDFDHRVDVFAAGIVLWELIANRTLYQGDDEMVVYDNITDTDAPDLKKLGFCDAPLAKIANKALTRDPERRYHSAEDFADDLRAYVYRTDPAFTHKRIAQVMERAFPEEKEELLALERGQIGVSGEHVPVSLPPAAPPPPPAGAPEPTAKGPPPEERAPEREVVRIPADAETRTQYASGPNAAAQAASKTPLMPATRQMRSGESNKRLADRAQPLPPGADRRPEASLPDRRAEPTQGDMLLTQTLVSRTSLVRRSRPGSEDQSAAAAEFAASAETKTAEAAGLVTEQETPYTSASLRSLPRKRPRAARKGLVLLAAASVAGIALIMVVAVALSRPPAGQAALPVKHPMVKPTPVRIVVKSSTPGAVAAALDREAPVPAQFSAIPGDTLVITLKAPGYQERSVRIDVPAQDARDQVVDVALTAADVPLHVEVKPADAVVLVGDEEQKPYVEGMGVSPGEPVTVQASAPGFTPEKREVTATAGEPLSVSFDLVPVEKVPDDKPEDTRPHRERTRGRPAMATLIVKTKDAMWGKVTIDGHTYAETTPLKVELRAGRHTVTVSHPPNKKTFVVTLKPGERESHTISFE